MANTKITSRVIADDAVTTAAIADDAITSALIADDAVGISALNVSDGSDGQVLTTNGSGTLSFATVSGTTINNNADNRVITGSGTANTLEGEANLRFDGTNLVLDAAGSSVSADDVFGAINFFDQDGGTSAAGVTSSIKSIAVGSVGASKLTFSNSTSGGGARSSLTEKMVIDESGRVGIGTTDPSVGYGGAISAAKLALLSGSAGSNGGSSTLLIGGDDKHYAYMEGVHTSGGSTELHLGTANGANNPTLKTKITGNGAFKHKQGTSAYANATSNYNEICSNADATANLLVRQGSTYYADCINLWYYAGTPNNTHSNFLNAFDSTATRAKIFANGGFANYQSNDSNLCDEREKKNIVASESTWNDVKSWNIKTFHYNEDDDSDAKRYGVIAQDIETTNPDLIVDWEKKKAEAQELWQEEDKPLPEGVSVGDEKSPAVAQVMRKAVKEQQMYMMAIKALQEAMAEIEDLKSRIETLEG